MDYEKQGEFARARMNPNPFEHWDKGYASIDANMVWLSESTFLAFHVTLKSAAKAILECGPEMHDCKVGFNERSTGPAFWVNCVPFVPYSVESADPKFGTGSEDMRVIAVEIDKRCIYDFEIESTWGFLQWPIRNPADVKWMGEISEAQFRDFCSVERMKHMGKYVQEAIDENYAPADGFVSGAFWPYLRSTVDI